MSKVDNHAELIYHLTTGAKLDENEAEVLLKVEVAKAKYDIVTDMANDCYNHDDPMKIYKEWKAIADNLLANTESNKEGVADA